MRIVLIVRVVRVVRVARRGAGLDLPPVRSPAARRPRAAFARALCDTD
jgi:hypothetical protein